MAISKKSTDDPRKAKKTRSRLGCKNCKLRAVKCDETKPSCNRCLDYGIICSYASKASPGTIQTATEFELDIYSSSSDSPGSSSQDSCTEEIVLSPHYIPYWTNKTDELVNKFQLLTAGTVSAGDRTILYRNDVVTRARRYPFMLEIIKALTSMHFRTVFSEQATSPTTEELEYSCSAVSLFGKEVVNPRNAEHQGVLLVAASMIYNLTFASVEATRPEDAWPMAPPSPMDLGWIKVSNGKRHIAQLAKPLGDDKLFATLTSTLPGERLGEVEGPAAALPLGFTSLFGLDSATAGVNNPYFTPALYLSRVLDASNPIAIALGWINVINDITPGFKELLHQKDPRALLLLACWYAKLSVVPIWWIRPRAIMEGQAICLYLDRYHADDMKIQVLLRFPKDIFAKLPGMKIVFPESINIPQMSRTSSTVTTPISTG